VDATCDLTRVMIPCRRPRPVVAEGPSEVWQGRGADTAQDEACRVEEVLRRHLHTSLIDAPCRHSGCEMGGWLQDARVLAGR